jgi:CheY-like chemotaxis protein
MNDKITIRMEDVFDLTPAGSKQLQDSKTDLSASDLELLVLIDGNSSVKDIIGRVRGFKAEAAEDHLRSLLQRKLINYAVHHESYSLDFTTFFNARLQPSPDALAAVGIEATSGTSTLQQQGYYVRIARSTAGRRAPASEHKLSVLIIEDEVHLGKLLRSYLSLDGFDARVATNRAEIVAELRRPPLPDLVLLDVMLPDADGFDILAAIRRHPALAAVPVVMLTAKSTREAVLKGLAGGADGYITKPFEMDVLMKAIDVVLGKTGA